jgi:hypothetical protein
VQIRDKKYKKYKKYKKDKKESMIYLSTGVASFYLLYRYYRSLLTTHNLPYYTKKVKDYSCLDPYPYKNREIADFLIKTYKIDEILKDYEKTNTIDSQYIVFETEICSLQFERNRNEKNNESLVFMFD